MGHRGGAANTVVPFVQIHHFIEELLDSLTRDTVRRTVQQAADWPHRFADDGFCRFPR